MTEDAYNRQRAKQYERYHTDPEYRKYMTVKQKEYRARIKSTPALYARYKKKRAEYMKLYMRTYNQRKREEMACLEGRC